MKFNPQKKYAETYEEARSAEIAEELPIWGQALTEKNLILIYARTGIGKTFFALELMHAIATGRKFLNFDCHPRSDGTNRRVLYCDGEMGRKKVRDRLNAIESNSPVKLPDRSVKILSYEHLEDARMPNLSTPEGQEFYEWESNSMDVLIIDNLNCCASRIGPRDDEFQMWERIYLWANKMKSKNKSIVFIHHTNKSGLQQSGTVKKENAMDTIIHLRTPAIEVYETDSLKLELHFEKKRGFFGKEAEPLYIEMNDTPYGREWKYIPLRDQHKLQIQRLLDQGIKEHDVVKMMGISPYLARRLMVEIRQDCTYTNGADERVPDSF